ncbi:MAG: FixH family protein [Phycisphaerales bacterium JB054]
MAKIPAHIVWPGFVLALLGMSVTMVTITVVAAVGDPSFAVESDYHDKAIRWDDHLAQKARDAELGWNVEATLGTMPGSDELALVVRLTDRTGAPIAGASIEGSSFHYAAADRVQTLAFVPTSEPGAYAAPALLNRAGLWDLRLTVDAAGEHFTHRQRLELGKVGG